MSKGKWFNDLSPDTCTEDAARHVLAIRLEVVRDCLALSLSQPEQDPEYVHQLRVGTRRVGAGLKIFADCFPKKTLRSAQRRIRDLRRAAGVARDWDVFLIELQQQSAELPAEHQGELDFLLGYCLGHRQPAQGVLTEAFPGFPFSFDRFMSATLSAVRSPENQQASLLSLAQKQLSRLLDRFEEQLNLDLNDYNLLHGVRIIGKQLRYAMEVLSACFESQFREELLPRLSNLQSILGITNDSYVAMSRYEVLISKLPTLLPNQAPRLLPMLRDAYDRHCGRLPKQRKRFARWLSRWRHDNMRQKSLELLRHGHSKSIVGNAQLSVKSPMAAPPTATGTIAQFSAIERAESRTPPDDNDVATSIRLNNLHAAGLG